MTNIAPGMWLRKGARPAKVQGRLGKSSQILSPSGNLHRTCERPGHPVVQHFRPNQFGQILFQQIGQTIHDLGPLFHRHISPGGESRFGCLNRLFQILRT